MRLYAIGNSRAAVSEKAGVLSTAVFYLIYYREYERKSQRSVHDSEKSLSHAPDRSTGPVTVQLRPALPNASQKFQMPARDDLTRRQQRDPGRIKIQVLRTDSALRGSRRHGFRLLLRRLRERAGSMYRGKTACGSYCRSFRLRAGFRYRVGTGFSAPAYSSPLSCFYHTDFPQTTQAHPRNSFAGFA